MNVLVTGATGVIGRRVVPLLLAAGHAVTAAARTRERLLPLAKQGASTLELDLFDRHAVGRAVEGHDVVANLATHIPAPGVRAFLPGAWRENDRIRTVASAIIAEAAMSAGARRVIQESFALIYPDSADRWVDETVPTRPASYNRSVLDAEASAQRVSDAGGTAIVLRFALLYGGVEDAFTRELLRYVARGWLPLFGRASGYVSMVTHDDAAAAVVAAVDAPGGVYNVVDDQPMTRAELAVTLGSALGVRAPKLPPEWMTMLAGSMGETIARSLRLSNGGLRRSTSWTPRYRSVAEGIQPSVVAQRRS